MSLQQLRCVIRPLDESEGGVCLPPRIMLVLSRPVRLALAFSLAAASASCANGGTNAPPKNAAAAAAPPASPRVTLELQQGPAPQLPNPMLVTDSVHGGAFESAISAFRPEGMDKTISNQMTTMCGAAQFDEAGHSRSFKEIRSQQRSHRALHVPRRDGALLSHLLRGRSTVQGHGHGDARPHKTWWGTTPTRMPFPC